MAGKVHNVVYSPALQPFTSYCVSLDYSEEQSGELETLRCIYSEQEFTEISDTPPCFKISVQATDSSDDKEVTGTYVAHISLCDLICTESLFTHWQ